MTSSTKSTAYVITGDVIPTEPGYLRGHGTCLRRRCTNNNDDEKHEDELVATVCGYVEYVNRLVVVRPINTRYYGEIGDVIVGRIAEVADKRWRVDINSKQHAVLMLSSVNLPGSVQRRRTHADSLQMRTHFAESDLISAEVQSIKSDGSIFLHTRSLKYGKLQFGQLLRVASVLIKRQKQHFHSLPCGVDIILGNNGYIWLSASVQVEKYNEIIKAYSEASIESEIPNIPDVTTPTMRECIARVRNSIVALERAHLRVYRNTIMDVYETSISLGISASAILNAEYAYRIVQVAHERENVS